MARPLFTVDIVSQKYKRLRSAPVLKKNEFKKMIASALAEEYAEETNELLKRGAGKIKPAPKKKPKITVSKELKRRSKRTTFSYEEGTVNSSMESVAPDIKQKYDVIASMFFRIVARTPYDEDYVYTVENPNGKGKEFRYVTNKRGKREMMPYVPYVRKHKKDDVVSRDNWKLTLVNEDGSSISFMATDFSVSYEHATNKTAYMSIAKKLRESNKDGKGVKNFSNASITNDNPYIDILEYGKYTNKEPVKEQRFGKKRYHGTNGGYSVQAPRGMVRITTFEFEQGEKIAKKEKRQVSKNDIIYNMTIPDDANEVLAQAMSEVDSFIDEKDILKAFLQKLPAIPLRDKSIKTIRNNYIKMAKEKLKKEDDEYFEELKKRILKEEQEEAKQEALENQKQSQSSGLKVVVKTPKQHVISHIKEESNKQYLQGILKESEMRPVYGTIDFGKGIGVLTFKCDKGKFYLTERIPDAELKNRTFDSRRFMSAKEYIESFTTYNEKRFQEALIKTIHQIL